MRERSNGGDPEDDHEVDADLDRDFPLGDGTADTEALVDCPYCGEQVEIAPVTRLPFPERGYVVSVSKAADLGARDVVVRENGLRVAGVRVEPLASSGLRFGVVLALDASESMTGAPAAAALQSARAFVTHRSAAEAVGIVAFNGEISVLRGLTRNEGDLRSALATQPLLGYGTRIHDSLVRSLALLREARLSSGSIVLLSDGADIGSVHSLDEAVAAAKKQQIRIFTVGLRSGAFDAEPLRSIAEQTGGSYAEARSAAELTSIYEALEFPPGEVQAAVQGLRYRDFLTIALIIDGEDLFPAQ